MTAFQSFLPLSSATDAEAANFSGHRIRRIEIRNFGGYHGPTRIFETGLGDVVFSGPNGAGKSTAFDALRLIFRSSPQFNSAGSEKKKVRTVESYYLGVSGAVDGDGGALKTKSLRGFADKSTWMGILVVFETADGHQFTAARLLYMAGKGEYAWRFVLSDGGLSLDQHFPRWESAARMQATVRAFGHRADVSEDGKSFFDGLRDRFGLVSAETGDAAFKLIDQAMGAKELGPLTTFVRNYLLPTGSLEEKAGIALKRIEDQAEARKALEAMEVKISAMHTILGNAAKIDQLRESEMEAERRQERTNLIRHAVDELIARRIVAKARRSLAALAPEIAAGEAKLTANEAELTTLTEHLARQGVDQIDRLRATRADRLDEVARRARAAERMEQPLAVLGLQPRLEAALGNEIGWTALGRAVETAGQQAARDLEAHTERELEAGIALRDADKAAKDAETALAELERFRSALDPNLLRARAAIAEELGFEDTALPFVAELARIRPGEERWEGVANRVLGGLGQQILVEPGMLATAKSFVNGRHWNARVVLTPAVAPHVETGSGHQASQHSAGQHPSGQGRRNGPPAPTSRSLSAKLEVRADHPFAPVVTGMVAATAPHTCVDAEAYRRETGWAVTAEGSVQEGGRVVKDDRSRIDDRRNFILGWSIEDRRKLLEAERDAAALALGKARRIAEEFRAGRKAHEARAAAAGALTLSGWPGFDVVDTRALAVEIEQLAAAIARLESAEITELMRRRDAVAGEIAAGKAALDKLRGNRHIQESRIEEHREKAAAARAEGAKFAVDHGRATAEDLVLARGWFASQKSFAGKPATRILRSLAGEKRGELETLLRDLRTWLRQRLGGAQSARSGLETKNTGLIRAFFAQNPHEGMELQEEMNGTPQEKALAIRGDWQRRLADIERDDLSSCKGRLAALEERAANEAVGEVWTAIDSYRDHVRAMVAGINAVFSACPFDPVMGTRARLHCEVSEFGSIRTFEAKIKALRKVFIGASSNLEIAEKAMEVLGDLQQSEKETEQKIRAEILNQKNWFTFKLEEFLPGTPDADGILGREVQRRVLRGEDGLSGGEGERFAMAMLGAGLAQAFGISADPEQQAFGNENGLAMIVIDEAFLRSNDDTSRAALDILRRLGLQVIAATPGKALASFRDASATVFNIAMKSNQTVVQVADLRKMIADANRIEQEMFGGAAPQENGSMAAAPTSLEGLASPAVLASPVVPTSPETSPDALGFPEAS